MKLQFKNLQLEDKPIFDGFFSSRKTLISVNDFATVYNWDINELTEYAIVGDALIIANVFNGHRVYYCPVLKSGHDISRYVELISEYENGRHHSIAQLTGQEAEFVTAAKGYDLTSDRDYSDYIYNASDMITFAGKKFHSKRNFVNRFTANYDYQLRSYTQQDYDACMGLFDKWVEAAGGEGGAQERKALIRALRNYDRLNLTVPLLFVGEELAAFEVISIDEVNRVAHVHFEKADTKFEGVFPAIINLTAQQFLSGVEYINRQEDMGIEGLRKSKLSYNPVQILNKYRLRTQY